MSKLKKADGRTTSKAYGISNKRKRLLSCALGIVVLALSFMAMPRTVFASTVEDTNFYPIDNLAFDTVIYNGTLTAKNLIYNGIVYELDQTNSVYELSLEDSTPNFEIVYTGLFNVRYLYKGLSNTINSGSTIYCWGNNGFTIGYSSPLGSSVMNVSSITSGSNYDIHDTKYVSGISAGGNIFVADNWSFASEWRQTDNVYVSYQIELECTCGYTSTPANLLSDIYTYSTMRINPTFTDSAHNIIGVSSAYNFADHFEDIEYKLYQLYNKEDQIFVVDNWILQELRRSQAGTTFADQLSSQMAQEASQAHNDSAIIQDKIQNDNTGASTIISGVDNDYNTAESLANDAIDGAIPNYNSELSSVESFDYDSFFTSQRNASLFWRDVGEYILSSSNLGFVATAVIITTLIILFVFLLRL